MPIRLLDKWAEVNSMNPSSEKDPDSHPSVLVLMESPPLLDLYFPTAVAALLLIAVGTLVADLRLAHILISEHCTLHTDELKRIKTRLLKHDELSRATKAPDTRHTTVPDQSVSRGRTRQRKDYGLNPALLEPKGATSTSEP